MALCVWGGGRPWPPHPLQESARHRPRLRLPSAGAGCVLPPDATHHRHTRRTPLHATSPHTPSPVFHAAGAGALVGSNREVVAAR
jgi:hypothetical protein